jgi:hypothetical protein
VGLGLQEQIVVHTLAPFWCKFDPLAAPFVQTMRQLEDDPTLDRRAFLEVLIGSLLAAPLAAQSDGEAQWAAKSVSKPHRQLGETGVRHVTRIVGPVDPSAGSQLTLPLALGSALPTDACRRGAGLGKGFGA